MSGPRVVVSLDFELRWGVADRLAGDFGGYRRNLEGVRDAVPALLELFSQRAMPATWATVGAVACENWEEYRALAPAGPRYLDSRLRHDVGGYQAGDPEGRLHFAPELVRAVIATPGQELGSHTFSHMFFREPGVMRRDVEADAGAVRSLFERRFGVTPRSLVFPRNQVGFVDVLGRHGIVAVRDNPPVWHQQRTSGIEESSLVRMLRLVDGFAPVGTRTFAAAGRRQPASFFLRLGVSAPAFALHRRCIGKAAATMRDDEVLHLWAHPHNFGSAPAATAARLADVLDHVIDRRPGIRFASMGQLAA